jgi:hypothetical protein
LPLSTKSITWSLLVLSQPILPMFCSFKSFKGEMKP